jgi:hypothetical protein
MGRKIRANISEELKKPRTLSETEISTLSTDDSDKMGNLACYMALVKGYCAINILVLPK